MKEIIKRSDIIHENRLKHLSRNTTYVLIILKFFNTISLNIFRNKIEILLYSITDLMCKRVIKKC